MNRRIRLVAAALGSVRGAASVGALPAAVLLVLSLITGKLPFSLANVYLLAFVPMLTVPFLAYLASVLYRGRRRGQLDARLAELQGATDAAVKDSDARLQSAAIETRRLFEYKVLQRNEAESELAQYLPSNPRRAKRLVNHERLYAQIAEDRHVYGGQPNLTRLHLAKWVLILEYWPRLGAALTRYPEGMEDLERATSIDDLAAALSPTALHGTNASDALLRVLQSGEALAPVLARLVRFEAARPEPESDGSEAAELAVLGSGHLTLNPDDTI